MSIKPTNTSTLNGGRKKRPIAIPSLLLAGAVIFTLLLSGCKDNPSDTGGDGEVDTENLQTDVTVEEQGQIGLVINTRSIARKGYVPTTATVNFSAPGFLVPYSGQTIEIDPLSNTGMLKIPKDTTRSLTDIFSEEQINQLKNGEGVDANISVSGTAAEWASPAAKAKAAGEPLANFDGEVELNASNEPMQINNQELQVQYPPIEIIPDMAYLAVATDDYNKNSNANYANFREDYDDATEGPIALNVPADSSLVHLFHFYFEETDAEGQYHIKMDTDGDSNTTNIYLGVADDGTLYSESSVPADTEAFTFTLSRDADSYVKIVPQNGANPLQAEGNDYELMAATTGAEDYTPFRLIPAHVNWSISSESLEFESPVTPPTQLDYAYNLKLTNCSAATLEQQVGQEATETTTHSMRKAETISLYTSSTTENTFSSSQSETHEAGTSVTASVGYESPFSPVSASVSVTGSYNYTNSSTNSFTNTASQTQSETNTSEWEEVATTTKTNTTSEQQTVTLPSYTAVQASYSIQRVKNVRMPYVQVLTLTATYNNGANQLTGDQIASSMIGQFDGVVTAIKANSVELSIAGAAMVDQAIQGSYSVDDLPGDPCE